MYSTGNWRNLYTLNDASRWSVRKTFYFGVTFDDSYLLCLQPVRPTMRSRQRVDDIIERYGRRNEEQGVQSCRHRLQRKSSSLTAVLKVSDNRHKCFTHRRDWRLSLITNSVFALWERTYKVFPPHFYLMLVEVVQLQDLSIVCLFVHIHVSIHNTLPISTS